LIALGFAAYIFFTKPVKEAGGKYYGELNGKEYIIQDEQASSFIKRWNELSVDQLVETVLSDRSLWETDLNGLPGFSNAVINCLESIVGNTSYQTLVKCIDIQ